VVAELCRLELPVAELADGTLRAHVLMSDRFGNLILDASPRQLARLGARLGGALELQHAGDAHAARRAGAFADVAVGELLVYEDAQGMVAVAVNQGSAAHRLGARRDDQLLVRRA
jgi:S-adenosyl-L-methionine hydrolase (adenosine-forming)